MTVRYKSWHRKRSYLPEAPTRTRTKPWQIALSLALVGAVGIFASAMAYCLQHAGETATYPFRIHHSNSFHTWVIPFWFGLN